MGAVNLVLLNPSEVDADGNARLSDRRAAHLREILKVRVGDTIRLGLLDGPRGSGHVQEAAESGILLKCRFESEPPPRPRLDLLLALPRPKVMRRLWPQLAAVGVGRIILTNAWKVERNYFDARALDPEFYRPLLIEGLQQSQDTHVPQVTIHRQLKVLVEDELDKLCPAGGRLLADPGAAHRLSSLIIPNPEMRVLVAVGPEGGWIDYERDLLRQHGFKPISMGARTLRSDTACIAVLALIHEALAEQQRPASGI